MAHREGNNHPAGTPVEDVQRFTPGKYVPLNDSPLIGTGVAPLSADGERAEFIFNDTRPAGRGLLGVGLMTPLTGADAIRALAGGVVSDLDYLTTKISEEDGHPKFIRAADGEPGHWVSARANFGNSAAAEDLADDNGLFHPSITVFLLGQGSYQIGTESVADTVDFDIALAAVVADDQVVVTYTPTFAGSILSDWYRVTVGASTAAKTAKFKLFINAVQVTGGEITLTTANADTAGEIVAGTAITALNVFDANDVITLVSDDVTAFVEGSGTFYIRTTSPTSQT